MKKIAVLVVGILFFASVDATGNALEIKAAEIEAEKDAKVIHWAWFNAAAFTVQASPAVLLLSGWFLAEVGLYDTFFDMNTYCCLAIYGIYAITPTAVALIHSPAPPTERLLGKSPDWVDAYTKAYKKNMRRYRAESSAVGCFTGTLSLTSTLYLLSLLNGGGTPGGTD